MNEQTTKSISFRLPRDLREKLHYHAKQSDLTASQILRRLLSAYEPVANAPTTEAMTPQRPTGWLSR
jgi:hypothetical protein